MTEDRLGSMQVVDLKEGGSEFDVTNENIGEYVELVLKHRLLMRMRDQLTAFLVGFYDVIPEALLSVFDFQELELLMCGLPQIDLSDWQRHTDYTGEFERRAGNHKVNFHDFVGSIRFVSFRFVSFLFFCNRRFRASC